MWAVSSVYRLLQTLTEYHFVNIPCHIVMEDRNEEGHDTNRNVNFSSTTVPNSNLSSNEKQYDPFEHRNLVHPNTFNGALMHVVKSSLGTGILAIPMAFKYSGLLVGAIGTILVGLLITHTVDLLVRISHKMCIAIRVPSLGFSDTAEAVFKQGPKQFKPFATFARLFVDVGLSLSYFFNNAVYIVFMADSIQQILDPIFGKDEVPRSLLILAITALLILFCQVRPLKFIVPFSVIANITMFLAFGITFCYMFKTIPDVPIEDRSLATGIGGIPKFLVTMIFAMEGIGTILPVENSLKKSEFIGRHGVLTISMSIIVLMFGTIGFFGYYAFGKCTEASITYSLPKDEFWALVGRFCIATAVFFTYMLQFYVPMEISWRNIGPHIPHRHENLFQIVYRAVTVIFITIIAIVVPDLSAIIDIVGSVFYATLGIFTPCLLDIILNWYIGYGIFKWRLCKNLLIMALAIFVLCSGVYFASSSLINGTIPPGSLCKNGTFLE